MLCVWGGGGDNIKEGDPHGSRAPVVAWGAIKNQASALCKLPADLTGAIKRRFVAKKLPIPHHNCCNRAPEHNVQANFSMFWTPSQPIRGIRSCGLEALSNLPRHLKKLHMLPLGAAGLAAGFGMGLGFVFLGTKLSSTISFVKSACTSHQRNHPHKYKDQKFWRTHVHHWTTGPMCHCVENTENFKKHCGNSECKRRRGGGGFEL